MTDEPKSYYALDMANGRTYIGRWNEKHPTSSQMRLEDVISTNTITNYNIYEEFPEVSDVKGLYKEFYKICMKKLGIEDLGNLTIYYEDYNRGNLVIMMWYLGKDILDDKI